MDNQEVGPERKPPTLAELEARASKALLAMEEFRKRASLAAQAQSREEELRERESQLGRRRDGSPLTSPESVWSQVTTEHDDLLEDLTRAMDAAVAAEAAAFEAQDLWDEASEQFLDAMVAYESLGLEQAHAWTEAVRAHLSEGDCKIVLTHVPHDAGVGTWSFHSFTLVWITARTGLPLTKALEIEKRVAHLGPEEIMSGISLDAAIELKAELAALGATAEITETTRRPASERRLRVPEHVRHEVWRRDEGRCVDCGSRERLEFDHIIPVSRGGSDTARNIELRCEPCNRQKAAKT